jgi:predicted nucleic acid-binding protein
MLAIDTNVVVRYLTGDDPDQAAKARRIVDGEAVLVTTTVLLETEWVLRGAYGFRGALLAGARDCEAFVTFDSALAKAAARRGGVPVRAP